MKDAIDCGCHADEVIGIFFCPLHRAAEEMRDLLQLQDDYATITSHEYTKKYADNRGSYELMRRRRALLAKVNR